MLQPLVVSIPEMCTLLGCSRSLAYELIFRRGEVTGVKVGRKTVVTLASIEAMLERNAIQPAADQIENDQPAASKLTRVASPVLRKIGRPPGRLGQQQNAPETPSEVEPWHG